jgi:hypothetical protein
MTTLIIKEGRSYIIYLQVEFDMALLCILIMSYFWNGNLGSIKHCSGKYNNQSQTIVPKSYFK